jgi:hypothetical protein
MSNREEIEQERAAARERVKCLQPLAEQALAYEQQVGLVNESLCGNEPKVSDAMEQKLTQVMQGFFQASAKAPASPVVEQLQSRSYW